jgi:dTDP-4-amino-4,6-dideoxygalactose transaminase
VPFVRPAVPPFERVAARVAPSYDSGMLTNGPLVAELEAAVAARLGVRNVVAVASCTAGLMLAVRALRVQGPVVLPGFTFSASAHAIAWNGCTPVFAECDPATFQLDIDDAKARVDGAAMVLATHVFGAPCAPLVVEQLAASAGVPVVFDAAHGFGAMHGDRPVGGFGDVEVFSLTPTKPLVAGEGGLVTTDDDDIAYAIRIGRDYANPGDYDTRFVGMNARMSELHAAVALESLADFDGHLERRREIARRYAAALESVDGVRVQHVDAGDRSTWKDFTIAVDDDFGVTRDELVAVLRAEGVGTRNYFDPPVHRQQAYAEFTTSLPVTEDVSTRVVSLPIYPSLADATVDRVVELIAAAGANAAAVRAATR